MFAFACRGFFQARPRAPLRRGLQLPCPARGAPALLVRASQQPQDAEQQPQGQGQPPPKQQELPEWIVQQIQNYDQTLASTRKSAEEQKVQVQK